jgi:hypothetical protein
VPLLTLEPRLELDRPAHRNVAPWRHDAEPVTRMVTAGRGAHRVRADGRLDGALGGAAEKAEEAAALLAVVRGARVVDVGPAGAVRGGGVVGHGGIEFGVGGVERRLGARGAEMLVGEDCWLGGRGLIDARWWRERSLVGFAKAEEGDCELGVGGDAFEEGAVRS